jgi:hypothetical protein
MYARSKNVCPKGRDHAVAPPSGTFYLTMSAMPEAIVPTVRIVLVVWRFILRIVDSSVMFITAKLQSAPAAKPYIMGAIFKKHTSFRKSLYYYALLLPVYKNYAIINKNDKRRLKK